MINQNSVDYVNQSIFSKKFRKPTYENYSLANISNTLVKSLSGKSIGRELPDDVLINNKQYDHVFLFFLDAFGWKSFQKLQAESELLSVLKDSGRVSKLTSLFPSTTTACVTSMHTGKSTNQSSMIAWRIYDPIVDEIIYPFLFSRVTDEGKNTLLDGSLDPKALYPKKSIYSELKQDDIIINTYANSKFTPSPFTDAVIKQDANVIAFDDYKQGLEMLTNDALQNKAKRTYSYFYLDEVDGTSHKFGPESEEFMQSATTHLEDIMKIFVNRVEGKINNALFVLMADHGQMAVDIDNPSYINQLVPNIEDYLHRSKAGRPLIPAGSARDMFLYAKNESREELQNILNEKLAGKAEIIQTEQLLENNIFGLDAPTKDFLDRVGNLVIFPYDKQAVWWYEPELFEINHVGMHGGLSIDEMEIPLALLEL